MTRRSAGVAGAEAEGEDAALTLAEGETWR